MSGDGSPRMRFASEPLAPGKDIVESGALARGEPPLPRSFVSRGDVLVVHAVERTWRSTNEDRGESYLARHWYALELTDGRRAVVYFDRKARSGAPMWWLYTLSDARSANDDPSERDEKPG